MLDNHVKDLIVAAHYSISYCDHDGISLVDGLTLKKRSIMIRIKKYAGKINLEVWDNILKKLVLAANYYQSMSGNSFCPDYKLEEISLVSYKPGSWEDILQATYEAAKEQQKSIHKAQISGYGWC